MNSFIKLQISLNTLTTAVDEIIKKHGYVPTGSTEGKTIKMKEFVQKYCGGKEMSWIYSFLTGLKLSTMLKAQIAMLNVINDSNNNGGLNVANVKAVGFIAKAMENNNFTDSLMLCL